jgi:hypothetical protein
MLLLIDSSNGRKNISMFVINSETHNGDLDLRDSTIIELPDFLTVNGDLWLNRSNIRRLPNNLVVKGDLHIRDTNIRKLPSDMIVGKKIYLLRNNGIIECSNIHKEQMY